MPLYFRHCRQSTSRGAGRLPGLAIPGIPPIACARCRGARWTGWPELRDVEFVSLQMAPAARPEKLPLIDAAPWLTDFTVTAAVLADTDLVIAVDTAVAHLAGAMGRPTWLLLPHVADWRWLKGRSDSPWYPSLRLFRQPQPGDWTSVVDRIADQAARSG